MRYDMCRMPRIFFLEPLRSARASETGDQHRFYTCSRLAIRRQLWMDVHCTSCHVKSLSTTSVDLNTPPLTTIAPFDARFVSSARKDRHSEICQDVLRSQIQANAKEGRHSHIPKCEQLENRLRLFQIRLSTVVDHKKKTLLRRVPVISLHF